MYCPRRFFLLEINSDWAENAHVVKANLMHEAVHSGEHKFSDGRKIVRSSVSVYNDDEPYQIFGVIDCVEFLRASEGVRISGHEGLFNVRIIEYKLRAPKTGEYHESDAIQMFAQKICADYVWGCDSEAYLYYSDRRRRIKLPFGDPSEYEKFDNMLKEYLGSMRELLESNSIPARRIPQTCGGCSLDEVCFPKSKPCNVRKLIETMLL